MKLDRVRRGRHDLPVPFVGLQGHPRVHRRLHFPFDEVARAQPQTRPGALPQADRRMDLIGEEGLPTTCRRSF